VADSRRLPIMYGGALMKELNNNDQPIDVFSRKWLLVVILCMVPLFLLFAVQGDPGRGRAAAICGAVGMTAIRACWHLRKHAWFWAVFALMAVLHVVLVLFIPWSDKSFPGYALLPIAALDYGIVYGSFKLAEALMKKGDGADSPA
jgi:hypothetical protein